MAYPKQSQYRRKRRFNPMKGLTAFLALASVLTVLFFLGRMTFGPNGFFHKDPPSGEGPIAQNTEKPGGKPSANDASETPVPTPSPTPEPTPRPTPEPMSPMSGDPAVIRMSWEAPSKFDGENAFPNEAKTFTNSAGVNMSYWCLQNNKPSEESGEKVYFDPKNKQPAMEGVLTFRGNAFRDAPSFETCHVAEKQLEIVWESPTGAISTTESYWPGTGWTGQPLLVHWPVETRKAMNLTEQAKEKDLVEVVYPTLDGNIYFLDLDTGEPTREKISVGFPFKGTGLIDPRGYPLLFTGQGLNENGKKVTEFQYRIFNLLDNSEIYGILGRDPSAFRPWGAFDSSGLIDTASDTLIECGENGLVYKVKLNTLFDAANKSLSLAPQLTKYRYHVAGNDELGIESSPAAYKNFLYFCDNGGILQCLDLNTMKPVWFTETGDDTDCTITLEESPEGVFLYTANEVDKRSMGGKVKLADCNIRKYNAITGVMLWQKDVPCVYQYYINGGALATPLVGKNDIADRIIFNIALTGSTQAGQLMALDKKTGNTLWERDLSAYSWSSPTDIYSDDGVTYGVFGDSVGTLHLFDPKTGKDLDTVSLGANIESSPAVYGDMIVLGSYAKKIFGVRIK